MEKEEQTIIALGLLKYNFIDNPNKIKIIKTYMDMGFDVFTYIANDDEYNQEKYNDLFLKIFIKKYSDEKFIDDFINILTDKEISKFNNDIFNCIKNNMSNINMKHLFLNGFDFVQGTIDEDDILSNKYNFYKDILNYKKDFDINYKYTEGTLIEIIEDTITYLNNGVNSVEYKNKKLIELNEIKKLFEVYKLNNELLSNKQENNNNKKNKI